MASNVVSIHPKPPLTAQFLHLGHTWHRRVEQLHARNVLPIQRAVIDPAHVDRQHELIHSLKLEQVQLVLDTKAAELATPGGAQQACRKLPWARNSGHWQPSDFAELQRRSEFCRKIAQIAVLCGVDVVLAPTHLLENRSDSWLPVDRALCRRLRSELDAAGGESIAIDYPVIASLSLINQPGLRQEIVSALRNLPIQSIWIRISGFGRNATCAGLRKHITLAADLQVLGKPIIADRTSGIVALSLCAVGAVGGFCHGLANNLESFRSNDLVKPKSGQGGGTHKWVYLPTLDSFFKPGDIQSIFQVPGTRSALLCNDEQCCPEGMQSMLNDHIRHALVQRAKELAEFNTVPVSRRADYLVREKILPVGRTCRDIARLKGIAGLPTIHGNLHKQDKRMDDFQETIEDLIQANGRPHSIAIPELHFSQIIPAVSGY